MRKRKIEPPRRAPRARNSHSRQRQRLIDACISALHIYGPSRTTVARVVAIAKMSPGIVRFYFDSKAAMLVASLQFLAAEFEEQVLVPVSKLKERPVSALQLMVDLYLDPVIASPRKVSVWYSFWGEASSRQEYYDICGQKDESFTALVRELIGRLIEDTAQAHLDPDAVALGLIGVLEVMWQDFAFQNEEKIDRAGARRRAMAYLRSVFPGRFPPAADSGIAGSAAGRAACGAPAASAAPLHRGLADASDFAREREALFRRSWLIVGHESQLARPGEFITADTGAERVLVVRDAAGDWHAMRNSCMERPHTLVWAGSGRFAEGIECAVHGLAYGLDGRGTDGSDKGNLSTLQLAVAGGWILVRSTATGDAPPPMANWPEARAGDATPLGVGFQTEVAADWKLLVEQWLEAAPRDAARAGGSSLAWRVERGAHAAGWSAQRYRILAGAAAQGPWQGRFLLPNQLLDSRPDGLSIWQAIPIELGRSRLRRLDYTRCASVRGGRAMQYLAGRIGPRGRRSALALAESEQQAAVRYGYPARSAHPKHPAVGWLRDQWSARLRGPMLDRPPIDS